MIRPVNMILNQNSHGKPAIIFCEDRKRVRDLSVEIARLRSIDSQSENHSVEKYFSKISDQTMKFCLVQNIAYLHEGLDPQER